jgi:hypothetical protein
MTGTLLTVRPLSLALAQYGVVSYLIPQSHGPLRRNLQACDALAWHALDHSPQ